MVSADQRLGLYIAVPVYFVFLTLCAIWAYRRVNGLAHDRVEDQLEAHYLGGRSFGAILTAGTVFASFFSGYTVVGIVNQAYYTGYTSFAWVSTSAPIISFFVLAGVRMRKVGGVRGHQSPVDFITDRFQSQVLRYTIVGIMIIVSVIYVSAQVIALHSTFNSAFEIPLSNPTPVILMFLVIWIFEVVGGLASVALTDCVQGIIMVVSFCFMAGVVKHNFGGWEALDPETYPRPDFYQTPSAKLQWNFWQFSWLSISLFTLPHMIARVYAAKDLPSLKFAWSVMNCGPWITMFVSVFLGTVGVQVLGGAMVASPFASIMEAVIELGGFPRVVGIVAFVAALAAIMSTADSVVIAISQLVTEDIIVLLRPTASVREIAWWGRGVSLVAVAVALVIGLNWDQGINDLSRINFPINLMNVPTFMIGLFLDDKYGAHPWCLAAAAILSTIYVFAIYFAYIKPDPSALGIDAGITGFLLQIVLIYTMEGTRRLYLRFTGAAPEYQEHEGVKLLYGGRPAWDFPKLKRYGPEALSPAYMSSLMTGIPEPVYNLYLLGFLLLSVSISTPLAPQLEPPLSADGVFAYAPAVVRGLPWWVFKMIIILTIPYLLNIGIIASVPDEFPPDAKEVEDDTSKVAAMTPGQRRLSALVKGDTGVDNGDVSQEMAPEEPTNESK